MTDFLLTLGGLSLTVSVLILLLWAGEGLLSRRYSALCRYLLWTVLLARLCLPIHLPFAPALVEIELPRNSSSAEETLGESPELPPFPAETLHGNFSEPTAPTTSAPEPEQKIAPETVIFALWLTVAAAVFAGNLLGYARVMANLRATFVPPDEASAAAYQNAVKMIGIRRPPSLTVSLRVESPMLCGFFAPKVVIPNHPLTEETVFCHELTHFRRGDLWIKLLALAARSIHWFNPLVHLAAHCCEQAMELSCDEAILAGRDKDARSAYGRALLAILRRCQGSGSSLTTSISPRPSAVKERFTQIMDNKRKKIGESLIAFALILCLMLPTMFACREQTTVDLPTPNLNGVNITPEGLLANPPVFINGSYIADDSLFLPSAYAGEFGYGVNLFKVVACLFADSSRAIGDDEAVVTYHIDGKKHTVTLNFSKDNAVLDGKDVPLTAAPFFIDEDHCYLRPEDFIPLLGAEVELIMGVRPAHYYEHTGEEDPLFRLSVPFYLYNTWHLVIWRYPAEAEAMTAEEAVELLKSALIKAYENTYGPYSPPESEVASDPYPGDQEMMRWKIANLTDQAFAGENDRFYRFTFYYDFLVDKFSGEIYTHYNGEAQAFNKFDPLSEYALTFAG